MSVKFEISGRKRKLPGGISGRMAGEKKAKSINFLEHHETSSILEILQLVKSGCLNLQALYIGAYHS